MTLWGSASVDCAEWGALEIDTVVSTQNPHPPKVTFSNSVFEAVIRYNNGGACGVEHAIRDWTLKSKQIDQVDNYVDACAQRGPLDSVSVVEESDSLIRFRLEYNNCSASAIHAISEYTLYRNSPVLKIDYLQYPVWSNTVDLARPGGTFNDTLYGAKVWGEESFIREPQVYPDSVWNTFDGGDYRDDPADAGTLNYNGHLIMVVANLDTGVGYGRIMPVRSPSTGGVNIVKNLWNRGFETFIDTGDSGRKAFTGYIFVFENGVGAALEMGKRIVDGDRLIDFSTEEISGSSVLESLEETVGDWQYSGWFGWVYTEHWPVVWQNDQGWLYLSPDDSDQLFIYDYTLGWLWTRYDAYPFMYRYSQNGWLYYMNRSSTERFYWDFNQKSSVSFPFSGM